MSLILAGNSHVAMLAGLGHRLPHPNTIFSMGSGRYERRPFSALGTRGVQVTEPHYASRLQAVLGTDQIDGSHLWGFVQVNHNSRIFRDPMWRRYEPAAVARPAADPVSRGLLEQIVRTDQLGLRTFYEQLLQARVPFFAVSAPPPRRDHQAVKRGTRLQVISYIDAVAREIWAGWLKKRGVAMVGVPDAAKDAEGFLLPKYALMRTVKGVRDSHHANSAYGELLVEDILSHLKARSSVDQSGRTKSGMPTGS